MVFLLIPSIISHCNVLEVGKEKEVEMGDKDDISGVRSSDVDIETKMSAEAPTAVNNVCDA